MDNEFQVGDVVLVELPYSEVCMHLGIAGQVRAVRIEHYGAQIHNRGEPYSSPVAQAEAGIPNYVLRTADRNVIKHGMRVWTNDLHPGVVDLNQITLASDGWFYVIEDGHRTTRATKWNGNSTCPTVKPGC
ncbi:hypothetical protein [Saccharopolyspora hattusasensis]|uniref:hypothetical protein n=1 Tax=Saccharopolyspora hattusasensis TaxID=1128679 RepID=UPI003D96E700